MFWHVRFRFSAHRHAQIGDHILPALSATMQFNTMDLPGGIPARVGGLADIRQEMQRGWLKAFPVGNIELLQFDEDNEMLSHGHVVTSDDFLDYEVPSTTVHTST